jgi:hypothetical protein
MIFGLEHRKSVELIADGQTNAVEFNRGMPKIAVALFTFLVDITAGAPGDEAHVGLAGDGIARYVYSMDNEQIIDVTPAELRALFEYIYSRMGGVVPSDDALEWHFPFYLLALLAPKLANGSTPVVGLPAGSDKVVRWDLSAGGEATESSVRIGWKKSGSPVTHSPLMNGRAISGLNASSTDEEYEINWQPVPTCGVIISGFSHFSRIRIKAADSKGNLTELCDVTPDQILSVLDAYNVQSITDPIYIPFDVPTIFNKDSVILFTTRNTYDETERIVPVQLVEEPAPAAA